MGQSTQFMIGAEVQCYDGVCGTVSRVVVDPVADTVTHLVVEPVHRVSAGRLVAVDLLDPEATSLRLRCRQADFDALDAAEETHFRSDGEGYAGYGRGETFVWPYYELGLTGIGMGAVDRGAGMGAGYLDPLVTTESLPAGEVSIRRGERVHATDGSIGRVLGLAVEPRDHHVTHVLLQEGHLFGRKDVAIPINAVTSVVDGIHLDMSKQQVEDLPPVDLRHRD